MRVGFVGSGAVDRNCRRWSGEGRAAEPQRAASGYRTREAACGGGQDGLTTAATGVRSEVLSDANVLVLDPKGNGKIDNIYL